MGTLKPAFGHNRKREAGGSLGRWPAFLGFAFVCLLPALGQGQGLRLDPGRILNAPLPAARPQEAPRAPVYQGYLYLESNQMRFELLMDAATALELVGQKDPIVLKAADKKALEEALAEKAAGWCRLGVAKPLPGTFRGVTLTKGKPGATLPLEEAESVGTHEALAGLMWEFPLPPQAGQVQLQWTGYVAGHERLPVQVFDPRMKMLEKLEAVTAVPVTRWRLKSPLPMPAPLAAVPRLEPPAVIRLPLASLIWLGGGGVLLLVTLRKKSRLPGGTVTYLSAWLMGGLLTWPLFVINVPLGGGVPEVTEKAEAEKIVSPLLRNVYRAFDFRQEQDIYDTLARSADGELLRTLYLEILQALTLDGREGTRVTISEFSAEVLEVRRRPDGQGFEASCQWTAMGTVGHWGHTHTRVNRYTARLAVAPVSQEWKLVGMEVEEARRL